MFWALIWIPWILWAADFAAPHVDVATGYYCYETVDAIVSGAEPIELPRRYTSGGAADDQTGGWTFFPHLYIEEVKYEGDFPKVTEISLPEPGGKLISYQKVEGKRFAPSYDQAPDILEGRLNPTNHRLEMDPESFDLTLYLADGGIRYYAFKRKSWEVKNIPTYRLKWEMRPNGNRVIYRYDSSQRIEEIRTTNPSGTQVYAWAKFKYGGKTDRDIEIETSDGHTLQYRFEKIRWWNLENFLKERLYLQKVVLDDKCLEKFEYKQGSHREGAALKMRIRMNGLCERIEYTPEKLFRVCAIWAPAGARGQWEALYRFSYGEETEMVDVYGTRRVFRFQKKTGRIEETLTLAPDQTLLLSRRMIRGKRGTLLGEEMFDGQGTLLMARSYTRDEKLRVVREETLANWEGEGLQTYCKQMGYDEQHRLLWELEPNGRNTCYTYWKKTPLVSEVRVEGGVRVRSFYDEENRLVEEVTDDGELPTRRLYKRVGFSEKSDPAWIEEGYFDLATNQRVPLKKSRFQYMQGRMIREVVSDGEGNPLYTRSLEYDGWGHLLSESDPLGRRNEYQYDVEGRRIFEKKGNEPLGRQYTYDACNRIVKEEVKEKSFHHSYDLLGRRIATVNPWGHTTTYRYDALGHVVEIEEPLRGRRVLDYDALGNIISDTNGEGETKETTWTFSKLPVREKDPNGTSRHRIYTLMGEEAAILFSDGSREEAEYDPWGRKTRRRVFSKDRKLLAEESWHYSAFDLLSHTDASGVTTEYVYDGGGRKVREILTAPGEAPRTFTFAYDALGQATATTIGDVTLHTKRDLVGRLIQEGEKKIEFDSFDNPILVTVGDRVETYEYDDRNRLVLYRDPLGCKTIYRYGDREKTCCTPLGEIITERYDAVGQCLQIERRNPGSHHMRQVERVTYDLAGRKTGEEHLYFDGERVVRCQQIGWLYNAKGQLIEQIEYPDRRTCFVYDGTGLLMETIKPDGVSIDQTYDELGRLIQVHSSDGTIWDCYEYGKGTSPLRIVDRVHQTCLTRELNAFGELVKEMLPTGLRLSKQLDEIGRSRQLMLPDGTGVRYLYEGQHLKEVQRVGEGGEIRYRHQYERRDRRGNPTLERTLSGLILTKEYDLTGQLSSIAMGDYFIAVTKTDTVGRPLEVNSSYSSKMKYTYDVQGQLVAENERHYPYDSTGNRRPASYSQHNELIGDEIHQYTYDRCGRPIEVREKGQTTSFTYDAYDRLIAAKQSDLRIEFQYDAFHRRIAKRVFVQAQGEWVASQIFFYFYDGDREIGAAAPDGRITQLRLLGEGRLNEIGTTISLEIDGRLFLPFHDLRGNLSLILDPVTRETVEAYELTAFGEGSRPRPLSPWRFSSKRHDDELGLVFFGRRYYVPRAGRWLTPDPAGFLDGPNLYAYVHNNPLLYSDPTGLSSKGGWDVSFQLILETGYGTATFSTSQGAVDATLYGIGKAVQFLGFHFLLPIPFIKTAILYAGKILQYDLDPIPNENPYSQILERMPSNGPSNLTLIFANGILNDIEEREKSRNAIRRKTGQDPWPAWTPTRGFLTDLVDAFFLFFGYDTPNAKYFTEALEERLKTCSSDEYVVLVLHSKGAALGKYALRHMVPDATSRIREVVAFGPLTLISRSASYRAVNVLSLGDPIPFFDLFNLVSHLIQDRSDVRFKTPKRLFFPIDHSFRGDTYQQAFDEIFHEIERRARLAA